MTFGATGAGHGVDCTDGEGAAKAAASVFGHDPERLDLCCTCRFVQPGDAGGNERTACRLDDGHEVAPVGPRRLDHT